ncbi:TonB-dependent receptor [Alcaligenaceae bacterium SJ-26]|nr:TonB-dependent receptor [Alcaligenaceae bacterium SJ-26]
MQHRFTLRPLPLLLAALWATSVQAQPVQPADPSGSHRAAQQNAGASEVREMQTIEVRGIGPTPDEQGADEVFHKNVSNVYIGREEIERYRIDAAGDVLKGLNGVYNMNTRTAGGAITPNIRGISGKGRIPVTIDGTEQTVDVWMNNYGVSDRNYVDPALFRSIAVDKSPDLSRGMKPGVGGSVAIRTIEADDILLEGEKWGLMLRTEASNNSVRPQNELGQYLGRDYRTIGATADGAGGGMDPYDSSKFSPYALKIDDLAPPRNHSGRDDLRFGGDQSIMLAGAFKTDLSDGLLAYTYRDKGNYFAGRHGAGGYRDNPVYDLDGCGIECKSSAAFVPNMAAMYAPGDEVFNSNTRNETWLAKNNWNLPNGQKISLQYMRNDIVFGEINPFQSSFNLNFHQANPMYRNGMAPQTQSTNSHIRSNTYKLGYELKPEGNRWIDLETSLWRVKTDSERHQSGGMSLGVNNPDQLHDNWYYCNVRNQVPPDYADYGWSCADLGGMFGFDANTTRDQILALSKDWFGDADRTVVSGALQRTQVTRDGASLSNRFKLTPTFNLTLGADFQRERLDEENTIVNSQDLFNQYGMATGLAKLAGPRGGKRQEWGLNLVMNWQATSRLSVQAGIRYHRFWVRDEALARERANRNARFAWGGGAERYIAGFSLPYWKLVPDDTAKSLKEVIALENEFNKLLETQQPYEEALTKAQAARKTFEEKYGSRDSYQHVRAIGADIPHWNYDQDLSQTAIYQLVTDNIIPFQNGKPDASQNRLNPEVFSETTTDPQPDTQGTYYKYLTGIQFGTDPYEAKKDTPIDTRNIDTSSYNEQEINDLVLTTNPTPKAALKDITENQKWAQPQKMTGDAWAPMLALTFALTDNQRLFARYAELTRFPSLYEATSSSIAGLINQPTTPGFDLKPERSRNWEVGYGFDFTPYWDRLEYGDVRLTYFDNTIENVIDTTDDRSITQYDKKITRGLELQSRIDTGGFFASLGGTYRLKNVTCDADMAFAYDMYLQRVPECIEGGFGATRFYQSLQPKYSINVDLGTRLFNRQLELGLRGIYHGKVETKQYDRLLAQGLERIFTTTGKPYHWRPTLLLDAYGRYQINKNLAVHASVTNLTNRYYLDPMSNVPTPGPGRTVTLGMQLQF